MARFACGFAALVTLSSSPAVADEVSGLRSTLLEERAHDIALTVERDHATFVVRRTVWNGADKSDQATFFIDLPEEAVATGLRTLGSVRGRPQWFSGELMEAEAAAEKYRELTGIGGYYPKDPALLSWRSQQLLALQVFPCVGGQSKTVEYTLVAPTHYRDGAFHVEVPALGTETLSATITARPADARDQLLVGGAPPPAVLRPEPGTPLDIALVPRSLPRLGGELVATTFADERVLTRYAVRAAPRLSEVPRRARIVLVLDGSLSTEPGFVENAKRALDAYLFHFADAEVELVVFNRKLERPFGKFLPIAEARKKLEALAFLRRNGSEIDRALFEADRLLASSDPGRPRRVVLVTDGRGRAGLTPERLRAATTASGAVIHVGILSEGEPSLELDEEHPWARGLEPNHGLVWRVSNDATSSAQTRKAFEEWARPVRLHHFGLTVPNLDFEGNLDELPPELDEGQGVEALLVEKSVTPRLIAEGRLWTERVSVVIERDVSGDKLWSALVFGSERLDELNEEEMMTLAMKGGAVSPVTSYLAIEPGVRPSTEGLDWGSGFGSGHGVLGGSHVTRAPFVRGETDHEAFLRDAIANDWRRCGGRPGGATVELETTLAEIVHVESVRLADPEPLLESCLREAVWDLVLPASFDEAWHRYTIEV